jgi:hypothetical protein
VILLINKKVLYRTINTLLYNAFGTRVCIECESIFEAIISTKWLCKECSIINRQQSEIKSNTKHKIKKQHRTYIYNKRRVKTLHDCYINHVFGLKPNNLSQEVITAKRAQLKLHRLTKIK